MIEHIQAVIFDIDGTLKDLCDEHSKALFNTLEKMNVGNILRSLSKYIISVPILR